MQVFDKILAKKFDELIVSLLLRMYEPPSEGSDISQFTKLVSRNSLNVFIFTVHAALLFFTIAAISNYWTSVMVTVKENVFFFFWPGE